MHRWARFIVALILAAALPLQSVAAATMQLCAPGSLAGAVGASVVQRATVAADSSAHAAHHRHHAGETVKLGKSDAEQPSHHAALAKSKCSVCADCCAGAAL